MSSAKKAGIRFVSCLHVSKSGFDLFHRAKPVERDEAKRNRAALRTN